MRFLKLISFRRPKIEKYPYISIHLVMGDIVEQKTDAIVNAADCSLLGGTGVDGAIHAAAGPELGKACIALNGCREGQAKATPGFNLYAKHVIHTVAPIWFDGANGKVIRFLNETLKSCFKNSINLADQMGLHSISFPMLGAGAFGWSVSDVAQVAKTAIEEMSGETKSVREVHLVAFGPKALRVLEKTFNKSGKVLNPDTQLKYHTGVSATDYDDD